MNNEQKKKRGRPNIYGDKKVVKRTYIKKKTGEKITKIYEYNKNIYNFKGSSISATKQILYKSGKKAGEIRKSALKPLYNYLKTIPELEFGTEGYRDVEDVVINLVEKMKKNENRKTSYTLNFSQVEAEYRNNQLLRLLSNTGFTVDQIAEHLNVSIKDLLAHKNWSNKHNLFTDPNTGQQYDFDFDYYDINKIFKKR